MSDTPTPSVYIPARLWFVGPYPQPDDATALIGGIYQDRGIRKDGIKGSFIPVFTTKDAADEYIDRQGRGKYKPFSPDSPEGTETVLAELGRLGNLFVGFNPTADHVERYPIARLLQMLRDGLAGRNPHDPG